MKTFIFVLLIACVFAVPQPQNDVGNGNEERVKRQLQLETIFPSCDEILKNANKLKNMKEFKASANSDHKKIMDAVIDVCNSSPIYKMDYLLGVPLVIGVYLLGV